MSTACPPRPFTQGRTCPVVWHVSQPLLPPLPTQASPILSLYLNPTFLFASQRPWAHTAP